MPPNTVAFDLKARQRSLFKKKSETKDGEGSLAYVSSILHDVRMLIAPAADKMVPATPAPSVPPAITSPVKNTPTKLTRYLRYAEEKLGINNATTHEFSLALQGYGPDILAVVEEKDLVACGLTAGDAIRLKRGAVDWWNSPEAKRPRLMPAVDEFAPFANEEIPESYNKDNYSIRFEKRFHSGGSESVFGSEIVQGRNRKSHDFSWYYFNQVTRRTEPVPEGYIPVLDPVMYPTDPFDFGNETPESSQSNEVTNE
jgi:hypothetical protein